jgi:Ribosomal protein L7/L12 C-terminal domain
MITGADLPAAAGSLGARAKSVKLRHPGNDRWLDFGELQIGGLSMSNVGWFTVMVSVGWVTQFVFQTRTEKRLRAVEIRLEKLLSHVGFVADTSPLPPSDDVAVLARRPGGKIAAIKAYREQTGAGLKEAKDAVEAIERGEAPLR